jgi:hypothetical protein
MPKRYFIIFLVFAVLTLLPACQANEPDKTDNAEYEPSDLTKTGGQENIPEFPEADFGGAAFTALIRGRDAPSYIPKYIFAEEQIGELVNDEAFFRNIAVEEKYNVKLTFVERADPSANLRNQIMAGDQDVDLILDCGYAMAPLITSGIFYNLNNLNNINPEADYWDSNSIEGYAIAGKSFLFNNDISVNHFMGARFIYFNNKLIQDYGLENPYTLIKDNQWTLDKFLEMAKSVSTDLGGQKPSAVPDFVVGMLSENGSSNGTHIHLAIGSGIRLTEKSPEGALVPVLYSEKTEQFISKVRDVLLNQLYAFNQDEVSAGADTSQFLHIWDYGRSLFATDHFLFCHAGTGAVEQFDNMTDFGIAPNPKWDSNQEEYAHKVDHYSLIFAIPVNIKDPDMAGIILDYWAYLSGKTVFPKYYEIFLKNRKIRQDEAVPILEIIKRTIIYDVGEVFSESLKDVFWNAYSKGNLTSEYEKMEQKIIKELDAVYDSYADLD